MDSKTKKSPKKAAAKKTVKTKPQSKMSQAIAWMKAEVQKAGGQSKLERGFRHALIKKAAAKFDLKESTCSTQYHKAVLK